MSTQDPQSARAWMDVRKRRLWTGARVPVELAVRDGALVLRVRGVRLAKRERGALVRLCGDEVLSTLIARREEPEIRVPLDTARFHYPAIPVLGRTTIRISMPGRPRAVLAFLDPEEVGNPLGNPYALTLRVLRAGPAARRRRDAWRDAIEAAAAAYRSSAVPS